MVCGEVCYDRCPYVCVRAPSMEEEECVCGMRIVTFCAIGDELVFYCDAVRFHPFTIGKWGA